jgi:hypothetical protein
MPFEKVHTIREFWDGIRSGVADLNGLPHYFSCLFDERADDYSDLFRLYPVCTEFMKMELEQWSIYRAWEAKFHTERELLETRPGHGGIDPRFDELNRELDRRISALEPLSTLFRAAFRSVSGQESLAPGILQEIEVAWMPAD